MQKETAPVYEHFHESPTAPRYSFSHADIHREDVMFQDSGGKMLRMISYDAPTNDQAAVRENLAAEGYVIGYRAQTDSKKTQGFIIPPAARPIVYDRSVRSSSFATYKDSELFNDLGFLLKKLADIGREENEITGLVAPHIALPGFTRPQEPKIKLVPGFEHSLAAYKDGSEAILQRYAVRLTAELGQRFMDNIDDFASGFEELRG